MSNMNTDKKDIRKYFSEVRESAKSQLKDTIICEKILADEKIARADTVLLFASFRSEVDTWDIANKLILKNIKIAYPVCGKNGIMTFHTIKNTGQLKDSTYGICEPDISLPEPEITDKTVCIVPALAFTENGGRLGYGGGYYDRFLMKYPKLYTIGLAYEKCLTETLPLEDHDVKVRKIITEERTVLCNE